MEDVLIDRGSHRETEMKRGRAKGFTNRSSKLGFGEMRKVNVESLHFQIVKCETKKVKSKQNGLPGPLTSTFGLKKMKPNITKAVLMCQKKFF